MDDDSSLLGTLFAGRFRIKSLLGTGGMGSVFLAHHEVLQRKFAIKVIRKGLLADLNIAARFRREARAASRIEHPHITYVFDFGHSDEGRPYIAMEYVEGPSLAKVLAREGRLPVPRALHVLSQIADALSAAHASNVIHRDLKPQNIVVTTHRGQQDFVKILDFGLAKIIGVASTGNLSRDGESFGTPEYMSPEQAVGGTVDHRTDIYAFGALAFEMLVGKVPFPFQGNLMQVVAAHVNKPPPVPSAASGREDILPALDSLVLRCLGKKPEDRYPDAAALHAEIRTLQGGAGATTDLRKSGFLLADLIDRPRYRSGEHIALSATLPLADESPREDQADPWVDPTDTEWPRGVEQPDPAGRRSYALEELAYAVRDRGIGSPEISQVLSFKLEADDRVLDLEADIAVLEAQATEIEMRARERESKLRQALTQLEHERAMLQPAPEGVDPNKTLPWGSNMSTLERSSQGEQLEVRVRQMSQKIQQISQQLERDLAGWQEQLEHKQRDLEGMYEVVERHEAELAGLLGQTRSQVMEADEPDLERLLGLAGL